MISASTRACTALVLLVLLCRFDATLAQCNPCVPEGVSISNNRINATVSTPHIVGTLSSWACCQTSFTFSLGGQSADESSFSISESDLELLVTPDKLVYNISIQVDIAVGPSGVFFLEIFVNYPPTNVDIYPSSIDENTAIGPIATFFVDDPNIDDTHTIEITYQDRGRFSVTDGLTLSIVASLDYESAQSHQFEVKATDSGGLSSSTFYITLTVNDVNEPAHAVSLSNNVIEENMPALTYIGELIVDDPENNTASIVLDNSTESQYFYLENTSLYSAVSFNYEELNMHTGSVVVNDTGGETAVLQFTVYITDANDPPSGVVWYTGGAIPENSENGTFVGTLVGQDEDPGDTVTLSLVSPVVYFSMNGSDVFSNDVFDFETQNEYFITVNASDGYNVGSFEVRIVIENVNEPPVDITLSPASVSENRAPMTVVGTLSVVDDSAGVTVVIVNDTNTNGFEYFAIRVPDVVTTVSFDYETQNEFNLTLLVTDSGGLTLNKTISITIENEEDSTPGVLLDPSSVLEAQPNDTLVGYLVAYGHGFGNTFTLFAGEANNSLFEVQNGVELRTATVLDYETTSELYITGEAFHPSFGTLPFSATITVINANEPPTNIRLSNNGVIENSIGELVGYVLADDPEGSTYLLYSLVDGEGAIDNDKFYVDYYEGSVWTLIQFDYEQQQNASIRVRVTDLTASRDAVLMINILDDNDPPQIVINPGIVSENVPAGKFVGTVEVIDQDANQTNTAYLRRVGKYYLFSMDDNNVLRTAAVLDYEANPSIPLSFRVEDNTGRVWNDVRASVFLEDSPDPPYNITLSSRVIFDNAPPGTVVGIITASDYEGGPFTFSLVTGAGSEDNLFFRIIKSENEWRLVTAIRMQYELKRYFHVRIQAVDSTNLKFSKKFLLQVDLNPVHVAPPPGLFLGGSVMFRSGNPEDSAFHDAVVCAWLTFTGNSTAVTEVSPYLDVMNMSIPFSPLDSVHTGVRASDQSDYTLTEKCVGVPMPFLSTRLGSSVRASLKGLGCHNTTNWSGFETEWGLDFDIFLPASPYETLTFAGPMALLPPYIAAPSETSDWSFEIPVHSPRMAEGELWLSSERLYCYLVTDAHVPLGPLQAWIEPSTCRIHFNTEGHELYSWHSVAVGITENIPELGVSLSTSLVFYLQIMPTSADDEEIGCEFIDRDDAIHGTSLGDHQPMVELPPCFESAKVYYFRSTGNGEVSVSSLVSTLVWQYLPVTLLHTATSSTNYYAFTSDSLGVLHVSTDSLMPGASGIAFVVMQETAGRRASTYCWAHLLVRPLYAADLFAVSTAEDERCDTGTATYAWMEQCPGSACHIIRVGVKPQARHMVAWWNVEILERISHAVTTNLRDGWEKFARIAIGSDDDPIDTLVHYNLKAVLYGCPLDGFYALPESVIEYEMPPVVLRGCPNAQLPDGEWPADLAEDDGSLPTPLRSDLQRETRRETGEFAERTDSTASEQSLLEFVPPSGMRAGVLQNTTDRDHFDFLFAVAGNVSQPKGNTYGGPWLNYSAYAVRWNGTHLGTTDLYGFGPSALKSLGVYNSPCLIPSLLATTDAPVSELGWNQSSIAPVQGMAVVVEVKRKKGYWGILFPNSDEPVVDYAIMWIYQITQEAGVSMMEFYYAYPVTLDNPANPVSLPTLCNLRVTSATASAISDTVLWVSMTLDYPLLSTTDSIIQLSLPRLPGDAAASTCSDIYVTSSDGLKLRAVCDFPSPELYGEDPNMPFTVEILVSLRRVDTSHVLLQLLDKPGQLEESEEEDTQQPRRVIREIVEAIRGAVLGTNAGFADTFSEYQQAVLSNLNFLRFEPTAIEVDVAFGFLRAGASAEAGDSRHIIEIDPTIAGAMANLEPEAVSLLKFELGGTLWGWAYDESSGVWILREVR